MVGVGAPGSIDEALLWARASLTASPSASLDAHLLLGYLLGRRREWLLAHGEELLPPESRERFERLVNRRAMGEPVAYLVGTVHWLDLELLITDDVLIPRPETECLVEYALALASDRTQVAVDVGTGSGAIAIALARALPNASLIGIDVSEPALKVAAQNVARYGLQNRIRLLGGSLLAPLECMPDLVVANLPYLSAERMTTLPVDVRFEPMRALNGGRHGLDLLERLVDRLAAAGWAPALALEIDCEQGEAVSELLKQALPPGEIHVLPDLAGRDRIVTYR